jgi:hypothetical protein
MATKKSNSDTLALLSMFSIVAILFSLMTFLPLYTNDKQPSFKNETDCFFGVQSACEILKEKERIRASGQNGGGAR